MAQKKLLLGNKNFLIGKMLRSVGKGDLSEAKK